MLADVTFSTEELGVIAALLVALAGAVGVCFRLLLASKDERIANMKAHCEKEITEARRERDEWRNLFEESQRGGKI